MASKPPVKKREGFAKEKADSLAPREGQDQIYRQLHPPVRTGGALCLGGYLIPPSRAKIACIVLAKGFMTTESEMGARRHIRSTNVYLEIGLKSGYGVEMAAFSGEGAMDRAKAYARTLSDTLLGLENPGYTSPERAADPESE